MMPMVMMVAHVMLHVVVMHHVMAMMMVAVRGRLGGAGHQGDAGDGDDDRERCAQGLHGLLPRAGLCRASPLRAKVSRTLCARQSSESANTAV